MHQQDWQEPLTFDWSGKNGPPFTEEELYNSEISRILRGDFHAPFEQIEYVRQKPWWNPQDPLGKNLRHRSTSKAYIPGKQRTPQYPKLSALTKLQHLLGLRVLCAEYSVPPYNLPSPSQDDFGSFEEIKELYEMEQKEYRLWARMCWVNSDCIRSLHLHPLLETVYEAQFELKKNEIHTLPHNFTMSAQISLQTRKGTFGLQLIKVLKNVDLKSLPAIDYPDVLEQDISVLRPYTIPKPCRQHSSRFVLPHGNTLSVLPLPEVQKELAHFAIENGTDVIASENALQCLLDTERSWMLPLSVVEVICSEGGGVKTVVVIGSEFCVKKECGAVRTIKAFRQILRNTFIKSTETSNTNLPTHQPASTKNPNQTSSSEDEQLTIDVIERQRSTESPQVSNIANKCRGTRDSEMPSCSYKPNQSVDWSSPGCSRTETKSSVQKKPRTNKTDKALRNQKNTFTESTVTSNPKRRTHQPARSKQIRDLFYSREDDPTSSSEDEQLTIDVIERQRSTESPQVSNITNKSRGTRDVEMPSCSYKPNRSTVDLSSPGCSSTETKSLVQNKPRTNSTDKALGNQKNTVTKSTVTSNTKSSTHQPDRTKEIRDLFYSREDDQTSSSNDEQLAIDVIERQRSTESPQVSNMTDKSRDTRDAEMPSCSYKPNRSTVDWSSPGCSSTETKFETEVSVMTVPQDVQKHINFAGMYIEIDEAQASDQISLDVTKLSVEAINDIIGVNSNSTVAMGDIICDINCTCKGTTNEVPPPRSFKKWQVNDPSNRNFHLIIHSSHKVRDGEGEVILEPIVEWQPELGACKQSAGRLRALALSLLMRPNSKLLNFRLDYKNGNIIAIDVLDEPRFMTWHGDKRSEIADRIHTTIDQLRFLKQGQYVLAHDTCHGANAMVYSTLATSGFAGSGEHTLSLRPESVNISDAEEAALSKIPPELSRRVLPYHKDQRILPLAFTADKNHVKENKKVIAALAKARLQAIQPGAAGGSMRRKKNRRKKKKTQQPTNAI